MEFLFSTNSGGDLRSDAHQSQIIGGDANVDHTQIIGDIITVKLFTDILQIYWYITVKLLGGIYPPIFPGFRHPCLVRNTKYEG